MTLGDRENVRVIGGLNFASLYTAINSDYDDIDAGVEDIIQTAKESLVVFETKKEEADDFEEDGI